LHRVRIENISQGNILKLSSGGAAPFALSPGVWLVHTGSAHVFKTGDRDWGEGPEAQAEDGNPTMLEESLKKHSTVKAAERGGTIATSRSFAALHTGRIMAR
jgi:hypothetical protein